MKNLTILATALLVSTTAFAANDTFYDHRTIRTEGFSSQEQAYNSGFDMVESLNTMSDSQLRWNLSTSKTSAHNIDVDKTEVTVEEFSKNRGEVLYRAAVDVDYHYTAHRDND
ncbi:DUF3316 domain-containing protein [Vibrio sp. HN007]|uniref:DUF3316 domain-containing protein n=1 Tax=Vibrio iocasae TaxID=3098914 RepID=UPI0035D3EEA0